MKTEYEAGPRFVLTGTCAYGPFTNESDIDIAMYYYDVQRVNDFLPDFGIKVHTQYHINPVYEGIHFMFCERKIQLIAVSSQMEMMAWEYATDKMKELQPIKERERRLKIFQTYFNRFMNGETL